MKITKAEALEILNDETIHEEYESGPEDLGYGVTLSTIFERDGKLYQFLHYDDGGIDDNTRVDEEVECVEVEAYQETVTKYRPIVKEKTA